MFLYEMHYLSLHLVRQIKQMYINSPEFVKRKVFLGGNEKQRGEQYRFGSEREQLAQHVRQQIHQHDQDSLILEKFRREAEEEKRKKFEAKRRKPSPPPEPQISQIRSQLKMKSLPVREYQINPQIQPTYSRIIDQPIRIRPIQHQQQFEHHSDPSHYDDKLLNHYQKLLKGKEKELKKKQRKIEKSKYVIHKMQGKINELRQDRRVSQKEQELELIKINGIVEEMNYKIAENKASFREELARLKLNLADSNYKQSPQPTTKIERRDLSIPTFSRSKIFQHNSSRILQGPSVYYELPTNSHKNMNLAQYQVESNLESVDRDLRKMKDSQIYLHNKLSKYRQLS